MIKDQRHIFQLGGDTVPGDVERHWHQFADKQMSVHGFMFTERRDAKAFRTSRKKLVAYLNHSRWVADCPEVDCNGGVAVWRDNPKACCLDCGTIFVKVEWPGEAEMNRVLVAALQNSDEHRRNWHPERQSADEAIELMT